MLRLRARDPCRRCRVPAFCWRDALYVLGDRERCIMHCWKAGGRFRFAIPFLDLHGGDRGHGMRSALVSMSIVQNPCDVFKRVHAYSPVWLWLGVLPITSAWDDALGLVAVRLFFLATLPFLPPAAADGRPLIITLGSGIQRGRINPLERANIDLLVFVLGP